MTDVARLMKSILRVGVDPAKHVIQVHAVKASGQRVVSRSLRRDLFLA